MFQDTVHDTAISYHRKLREKAVTKSELDDIPGIGEVKKKALVWKDKMDSDHKSGLSN